MPVRCMEISSLIPHIEALIFASDKPLTSMEITELINQAFGFMDDKISLDQIESAIEGTVEKYQAEFYPFEVRQSGGGWQFLTKKDFHKTVAQLNGEKFLKKLSSAALETLAIIAYKQPVTKGEIEAIRGVSTDYAIQKLLEKELIVITGRNEKLPGHPLVYATSKSFMDYFGINSPEDLPRIKEVLAEQAVEPTPIHHTDFEPGELLVSDNGELIEAQGGEEGEAPAENSAEDTQHVSLNEETYLESETEAEEKRDEAQDLPQEEQVSEEPEQPENGQGSDDQDEAGDEDNSEEQSNQ